MLGNWSFGDYFKEEAIFFAYDFLVNVLKLNKDQIYVTYFSDNKVDLPEDKETFCIWQKYLPTTKIIKGSFRDNFWEMAETGPCGPCTEIHYDKIGNRDASQLVNKDDPNVLEIWNVVFMEYNRTKNSFLKLNKQCVDTGIDHSRTIAVCLHDKVNYSNEGRGYVLRRITRRALRFATEVLNLKENFLCELVSLAGNLLDLKIHVTKVKEEEILFSKTLKRDLARILAQENGLIINEEEFGKEKELAKERSKSTKEIILPQEFLMDVSFKYTTNKIKAKLLYYSEGMCVFDKTCFYAELGGQVGDTGTIIFLEDSSLLNEYDTNKNEKEIGVFEVTNTKLINKTVVHFGNLTGNISNKGILPYNTERREKIKKNHTATHLLNYFLRTNICNAIKQKGSLVSDDKLRFDFEFK
ncbi:alanine--tRNA ligase-like [Ctenocephalides felis]|uniref:alanine--tRNA ligase-like n=1 Tax=Ctenocephalides felis TaxID=7515 RepID=UPI000E6E4BD3|nr:alanine--tRNA ligase-like [Ctenocephalides felis]